MDNTEVKLLATVTANYLFLGQFETFRASLKNLLHKEPDIAIAILQAIVQNLGDIPGVLWSKSITSPSHLAWRSFSELSDIQSENEQSLFWGIDQTWFRCKLETLLLLQQVVDVVESKSVVNELSSERDANSPNATIDFPESGERIQDISHQQTCTTSTIPSSEEVLRALKIIQDGCKSELASYIKSGCSGSQPSVHNEKGFVAEVAVEESLYSEGTSEQTSELSSLSVEQMNFLQSICTLEPEMINSICWNLAKQKKLNKGIYPSSEHCTISYADLVKEKKISSSFGSLFQRKIQEIFLGLLNQNLETSNVRECLKYLRFLHYDFGLDEDPYRNVIHAIVRELINQECTPWKQDRFTTRLLELYESIQASGSAQLVSMIESAQDSLLNDAIESSKTSNETSFAPPLSYLHHCFRCLRGDDGLLPQSGVNISSALQHCLRQLCHYSWKTGKHMFDIVMSAALCAIKAHEFQKAVDVLSVFPRLQPLAAVIGWDLLAGDTSARRQMMELLWIRYAPLAHEKHGDELCCVDHLCDQLCYRLDLAYYAAHINSGQDWTTSIFLFPYRGKKNMKRKSDLKPEDAFVANLSLERLAMHSPIRVLFDVVPEVDLSHARTLLKMCPVASSAAENMRVQDLEIIEIHFGIQATVLALAAIGGNIIDEGDLNFGIIAAILEDLRGHIQSILNIPRRIFFMSIVVDLLHMDDAPVQSMTKVLETKLKSLLHGSEMSNAENEKKMTPVFFVGYLLNVLRENIPSSVLELEDQNSLLVSPKGSTSRSVRKAWEIKLSNLKKSVEDWEWRLSVLQRLELSSHRQWQWKEAMAVLRAAPSTLLNMCVQRAQYDLGEEAIHRFELPPEDEAALQLAEWVDGAVARATVEDVVSRVAEGASTPAEAITFAALRAPLAPLASALLCIDVAAASARAMDMSKKLLQKARTVLTEASSLNAQRQPSNQPEHIQEACILLVSKRVGQCLQDLLEKVCIDKHQTLQSLLSGLDMVNVTSDSVKQGHRYRALNILQQTIEDAHNGKRMFLSGKLHNLVKALADDDVDDTSVRGAVPFSDRKTTSSTDNGILLGCGMRSLTSKQPANVTVGAASGDHVGETTFFPLKGSGKRFLGPLSSKPFAYLSAFILYVATIGDIVDGVDTTHDFNFFSLVYERSNDLLTRLVFERGNANAAGKVSEIMDADLAHEIITACVPPVYPPKSSRGWACVPLLPSRLPEDQDDKDVHSSGLYPLKLDIVKHLVTLSPVRAILACVFGTSIFREGMKNGSDRTFHEFALDQSDRFPTLNRWIQNQTKLQNLSDFPASFKNGSRNVHSSDDKRRAMLKRNREHDSDTESEEDEEKISANIGHGSDNPLHETDNKDSSGIHKNSLWLNDKGNSTSPVLELENESIYEETVNRLVEEGKLVDALAIADRHLRDGAPDYLLQLLIEKGDQWQAHRNIWKNTWQYCIRLRDKKLAATLALKNVKKWDLDAAIDVLTMCSCHIKENDSLYHEVLRLKWSLQLYSRILRADGRFNNWQEVESLCQRDPEELALRLAGKGAVSAALEVAENYQLRSELRWELQGRQLVKLLTSDPVNGGGPAEALRFLGSLQTRMDALPVAKAAMEQLPSLRSKQLLVHFFLKRQIGALSEEDLDGLHKLDIGLRILGALPVSWQQRCGTLHGHPQLILETLLMWKQINVASELLSAFPSLRNDELILRYATKAISTGFYRKYERRLSNPTVSAKGSGRSLMTGRSSSGNNPIASQKEVKRPFLWSTKDSGNKITPRDANKKRKSTSVSPSQKPGIEFSGVEERPHATVHDALERLTPFTMTEGWVLTGDPVKDDAVRESHRYEGAPCFTLFKALLELCSSEEVAVKSLVSICIKQMKHVLSSENLPSDASSEVVERAFHATEAFVQALLHAKVLLRKLLGSYESTTALEATKENNNGSDKIRTSKISELPESLSELLVQVVDWLSRAELIQSLLSASVPVCLDDVLDKRAAENLRDRLISGERYSMAVYCCTKCKVDAFPVWRAWAHALVQMEHYPQARAKLKQALKLHTIDPKPVVREIISTMESCPAVDVSSVRSLYDHMEKNASTILDDSLSADAYLNVLYMPSSFTKSERSRRSSEDSVDSFAAFSTQAGGEEGPRSNLDRSRYEECIFYLQEYSRQDLLEFMFKHCRYADACLLFFPPKSVPSAPQAAQGGKSDPLLTEYGSIDDLCEICVAYGAMPVLERVIATRELSSVTQDPLIAQHTAAALARICTYCENHKHFNHLYRFQVLRKDHVAAGLCCIQLFLNSSSQDQALRHLERAKTHFDEGYHVRLQGGDVSKGLIKVTRGKSPSERFSDEELAKFSSRVSLQMEVVRCFSDTEGHPWKHSLFGNPNDADTFRRRVEIVEALTERNFELAFRIILDFELPAVQIYAAVAASLAERKKGNQLAEHLKNIKPYITDDDDLDQVILAAIMVFAKHKERPDRLIEMLSSNHRKVLSCVACGRLKTAFQIASRSGSIADVQYVSDQAKRTGSMSVVDMCKQWLSRQK